MVFAINPTAQKSFSAFQVGCPTSYFKLFLLNVDSQANAMGTATTTAVGGASGTASSTTASETAKASSGAVRLVGSATGLLTLAGLVAGLTL
jgi:mannose-6-phosphate isomerase class I